MHKHQIRQSKSPFAEVPHNEDPQLFALNAQGQLQWDFNLNLGYDHEPPSASIDADGTVYVGDGSGTLYAFNPNSNARKWTFVTTQVNGEADAITSTATIGPDGTIYFGTYNNVLYAVTNGAMKWSYTFTNLDAGLFNLSIYGAPVIAADGTIYVVSADFYTASPWIGYLSAMPSDSTATGGPIWQVQLPVASVNEAGTSPGIGADGTVYIVGSDGNLYAIQAGDSGPATNAPWPLWRKNSANQANAALP